MSFDKSCIDCHNLRTKKVDGKLMVACRYNKIKRKFYNEIKEIGKNIIDSVIYKVQANKCDNYTLDDIGGE